MSKQYSLTLLRSIGLSSTALLLPACATVPNANAVHIARPGYICTIGKAFEDNVWGSLSLSQDGQPIHMRWEWKHTTNTFLLRFGVIGSADGTVSPDANDGFAFVSWAGTDARRGRPDPLRLELTSAPDSRNWYSAPFVGAFERQGDRSLHTSWADLSAFVRGADRLAVVLRNQRGQIVHRTDIDPRPIVAASEQIADAQRGLRALATDYRTKCESVDDLDPQIIVT